LSNDGGKRWGPPLYTGLAERFPYIVPAKSRLPLIAGDRIRLEVEESLIDTATIFYPPVGLHVRRKRSGIYLDLRSDVTTRLSDVNSRIGELRSHMDSRFDDMRVNWQSELHRVEEVLDARLKHLEER